MCGEHIVLLVQTKPENVVSLTQRIALISTCFFVALVALGEKGWAQSLDDPLSPRQSRALNKDFDQAFRLRSESVRDDGVFAFSGGIGAAFERASGGTTSLSLPFEIAATHRPSGVVLTFLPDLHTWAKEDGTRAHGVGNPSASLMKRWSFSSGMTDLLLRLGYEAKSGSDVGGPSVSTATGIVIQKLDSAIKLRGQATIGQIALGGSSGNARLIAAAVRAQLKLETTHENTVWIQLKSFKAGNGNRKSTGVLGIDTELTNELTGSLSLSKALNGVIKPAIFNFDLTYGF